MECKHTVFSYMNFCPKCGLSLKRQHCQCGNTCSADDDFCFKCGKSLKSEAEIRHKSASLKPSLALLVKEALVLSDTRHQDRDSVIQVDQDDIDDLFKDDDSI